MGRHLTAEEIETCERIKKWALKREKYKRIGSVDFNQGYAYALLELKKFMDYLIEGPPENDRF